MGLIVRLEQELDEDENVQRLYAITSSPLQTRVMINRVTSRMTLAYSVGQRDLLAAAYDEIGLDLVWNDGPFSRLKPEEKFPKAQEITFKQWKIEGMSEPLEFLPPGIKDEIQFGLVRGDKRLYMWEIPFDTLRS